MTTLDECMGWLATLQRDATIEDAENCAFAQAPDLCASPVECEPLDGC